MNTLMTERLIVRSFTLNDLSAVHQLLDIELKWSGGSFSLEQRLERLQFYVALAHWSDAGKLYGYRAIVLPESNKLIGICGFTPTIWMPEDREPFGFEFFGEVAGSESNYYATNELEIGYALGSPFRGQGYATEAVTACIKHVFSQLKVGRILAVTDRANLASKKLMGRLGMRTAVHPHAEWPGVLGIMDNTISSN